MTRSQSERSKKAGFSARTGQNRAEIGNCLPCPDRSTLSAMIRGILFLVGAIGLAGCTPMTPPVVVGVA